MAASEIVQTIADQINSIRGLHPSTKLLSYGENTLRVASNVGRNHRKVDITYVPATDLYTVQVHTFNTRDYEITTEVTEMVFADSLPEFCHFAPVRRGRGRTRVRPLQG